MRGEKMEGEAYKSHDTRKLLREYINENPGVTFKVLMNAFNINKGTLTYHLGYMMRRRMIVQEKKGRERCYFSYIKKRFPFTSPDLELNQEQERMLEIISGEPGITIDILRKRSGLKRASFTYNLNKLKKLRLVWRVSTPEGYGYEIVTEEKLKNKMLLILVNKFNNDEIDSDALMEMVDELLG